MSNHSFKQRLCVKKAWFNGCCKCLIVITWDSCVDKFRSSRMGHDRFVTVLHLKCYPCVLYILPEILGMPLVLVKPKYEITQVYHTMSHSWNVCKDCVYWRVYTLESVRWLGVGSKINIESDESGRKWKSRSVTLV